MNIGDLNKQIAHLSDVFTNILVDRGLLESKLFPVNAYICCGFYTTYDRLYDIMKEVWKRVTPEKLAQQSKTLLSQVHALSITYQWLYYGLARMGVIFNKCGSDPAKEPREKQEQWRFILENWYRLATNYFNTGKPTVASAGYVNLAFGDDVLNWIKDRLQPVDQKQVAKVRRAFAAVDLYAFMEECEARAKIIDHGPYPMKSGEMLVLSEYTNLYDGHGDLWLPWSATEAKLPTSTLGVAMTIKNAKAKFIDVGTMALDPADYGKLVTKAVVYARHGDKVVPLGLDELTAYAEAADAAQAELFMRFSEWNKRELLIAGAKAYFRGYARFTNQVGLTRQVNWDLSPGVMKEHVPYFLEHDADPAFVRMFRSPEDRAKDPTFYYLPGK
jgi:hypothetical protein